MDRSEEKGGGVRVPVIEARRLFAQFTLVAAGCILRSNPLGVASRRRERERERGGLGRRNVNTGRPISLIGPIRSNARHSPAHIPRP